MNINWLPRVAVALLAMLILSACSGSARQAQIDAGKRVGVAAAGITLGEQPMECGQDTPHATLFPGQEATTALSRERGQLDAANASKRRCFRFNEDERFGLQGTP
jgi:hypothetical protein